MITENLFDEVLVKPAQDGATELLALSGYVSLNMAHSHLDTNPIKRNQVRVKLIYGMARTEVVPTAEHEGFKMLETTGRFECHYRVTTPAVHSKVYVWMADGIPIRAFVGSANYTHHGFGLGRGNGEAMAPADPRVAYDYFEEIRRGSLEVGHPDMDLHIRLGNGERPVAAHEDCRVVSLLMTRGAGQGQVHNSAGLNWGFRGRPGYNRNLNEAYIQIGSQSRDDAFFPPAPNRFTVITDDGLRFEAVRAQKSEAGDAIETPPPEGNSLLGAYFRRRIGIADGTFVTRDHLERYGRTDVEFCKIDEETFFMDFSV